MMYYFMDGDIAEKDGGRSDAFLLGKREMILPS